MYQLIKPLLFNLNAERAHYTTTSLFTLANRIPIVSQLLRASFKFDSPKLERTLWGLNFKNPVGLAAGFDKNGQWVKALLTLISLCLELEDDPR